MVDFKSSVQTYLHHFWVFMAICRVIGVTGSSLKSESKDRCRKTLSVSQNIATQPLSIRFSLRKQSMQLQIISHHPYSYTFTQACLQRLFHHARASQVCPHSLPASMKGFQDTCQALSSIKSPGRTRNLNTHSHNSRPFGQVLPY